MRRLIFITVLIGTLLMSVTLIVVGHLAYRQGLDELGRQSSGRLELYVTYLQGILEKYEVLPELLVNDKRLVNFLQNPGSRERIAAFNRYMETINNISDAADTYLMDKDGLTIVASNWQEPRPFVGRNFSYRPYFQQAMRGELGRYFALGTASSQRGYYFAYPVRHGRTILGALVMKINIDSVEYDWASQDDTFLVTDPDGVIFITTNAGWRYRTLRPLTREAKFQIVESKRYPKASLAPLNIISQKMIGPHTILTIDDIDSRGKKGSYLAVGASMPQAGWEVQIQTDIRNVKQFVLRTLIGVSAFFVLGILLVLVFWQRRQRLSERYLYEEETRRMLEDANEELETRVTARTRQLTESNVKLRQEIEEREKTESELRRARRELVHAAKLAALGQMSASITHELNQPLAAIRSYSDNAVQFLQKSRGEDAIWNLKQIGELTDRMARLGTQLKLFARKSSGKMQTVPVHGCLDGALELLGPGIKKIGVTIEISIIPENIEVHANNVLLQQVLMNLIGNALHAVEQQNNKYIHVQASYLKEQVLLAVEDNGPGIDQKNLELIFEPFFTTKEPGQGLGLGLAISSRIVQEMGGDITVAESRQGARFEICLKKPSTS